jgi:hypothetical protein
MGNANLSFGRNGCPTRWVAFAIVFLTLLLALAPAWAQEKNPASPKEALSSSDFCRDTFDRRTQALVIDNQTSWTMEIAFLQGVDESGKIPPGFVSDSGVFVAGVNQPGPSVVSGDPCYAGGHQRPIQATRARASVLLVDPISGAEAGMNLPDMNGDIASYWITAVWELGFSPVSRKDGKPVIEVRSGKRKKS